MDCDRLIGAGAVGLIGATGLFVGTALYDGLVKFPEWKSQRGGESITFYKTTSGETVVEQMEPSWSLYMYLPATGAFLGAAGFMVTHPRKRESQSTRLDARVNPATQ